MFLGKQGKDKALAPARPTKPASARPAPSAAKPAEQFTGQPDQRRDFFSKIVAAVIIAFVLVGLAASLIGKNKPKVPPPPPADEPIAQATKTPGFLPGGTLPDLGSDERKNSTSTLVQAEKLQFADFYQPLAIKLTPKLASATLPFNVKAEVSNYYNLARKIPLDKGLDSLNQNGFAVLANPFAGADNFFAFYQKLAQKEIPLYLTGSFLLYYHQNVVKNTFKEIENLVFYKELWQVAKYFYETANRRYLSRRQKLGLSNDPVLEGERLETAFFATALELLKPKEGQINTKPDFSQNLFNQNEAYFYKFSLLPYLKDDVEREVQLILAANKTAKSPVLLYQFDYHQFRVPAEYQRQAKLNNFYLATKWFNSLFPLYYQAPDCENCLLDYNDWLRNFIAASFIVYDFSHSQKAKNQWARIYKVISYFRGLRQELTYLHYNNVFNRLWGPDYSVADVFSLPPEQFKKLIASTQPALAELPFSRLEGSFDRADPNVKPQLGMRILQDDYWPQNYILSQLIEPYAGQALFAFSNKNKVFTACRPKKKAAFRCRGFGLDIINLVYPLADKLNDPYFKTNIAYQNYPAQMDFLRRQLKNFTDYTWQANVFWSNLHLIKNDLAAEQKPIQPYLTTSAWQQAKVNRALAAWVNLQVNADLWQHAWQNRQGLGAGGKQSHYALIEPDLVLVNELIANTEMLRQMFKAIGVLSETDITYTTLTDHLEKLNKIKSIIAKETQGKELSLDDIDFIYTLATGQSVVKPGRKEIILSFPFTGQKTRESIKGVKLLAVVNEFKGQLVIGVGAVSAYQEGR